MVLAIIHAIYPINNNGANAKRVWYLLVERLILYQPNKKIKQHLERQAR